MITLREININNFWKIMSLKVSEEQKGLVASNAISVAQAKVQPECIPLAIYEDETPVGFIMYCIDREDNEWWIYRLMVDKRFQSKGIGRAAMEQVIEEMKKDTSRNKIYIDVEEKGTASKHLYQSLGFEYTGQKFETAEVMMLKY